jgi:2-oxoisovalerate dehydrogenase E1 component alpha subunit
MDDMRARMTQELLLAYQKVKQEPQPDPKSIWEHVFAEKNVNGGGAR